MSELPPSDPKLSEGEPKPEADQSKLPADQKGTEAVSSESKTKLTEFEKFLETLKNSGVVEILIPTSLILLLVGVAISYYKGGFHLFQPTSSPQATELADKKMAYVNVLGQLNQLDNDLRSCTTTIRKAQFQIANPTRIGLGQRLADPQQVIADQTKRLEDLRAQALQIYATVLNTGPSLDANYKAHEQWASNQVRIASYFNPQAPAAVLRSQQPQPPQNQDNAPKANDQIKLPTINEVFAAGVFGSLIIAVAMGAMEKPKK